MISDEAKSFLIFAGTLIIAEITMLIDANLKGFQEIDFIMACKMAVLGVTNFLAWLTLSPKDKPLGRS